MLVLLYCDHVSADQVNMLLVKYNRTVTIQHEVILSIISKVYINHIEVKNVSFMQSDYHNIVQVQVIII